FPLLAWGNPVSTEQVTARLVAERLAAAPGTTAELLLVLDIRPGWHTYWRNPGDSGEPPRVIWTLPEGVTAGPLGFPAPDVIPVGPLANFGYSGRALHPVTLGIPAHWPPGEPVALRAEAHWLVCAEHCIPESAVLELSLPVAAAPGDPDPAVAGLFAEARQGLPEGVLVGARWIDADEEARLEVPLGGMSAPTGLRFFPVAWGLIEHAADQPWERIIRTDGDWIRIHLTPGSGSTSADPAGLLVLTDVQGALRAYEVLPLRLSATSAQPLGAPSLGLPLALGFALLGGLILNLMPCVFPVLAIKTLGLAGQGGLATRDRALHGLAYTAGVLVFFGLLGALLLGLRAGGAALGWGFQLQYPPFVAAMAYLFLVLGLALSGALTLGARLMGIAGGAIGPGQGLGAAFGTGALAALVAAPCTAPFMGAALGYAVTLPWLPALAILLTLGLGLAAPFLLLSLWPALAARLPRPGPWMEVLKQLLAFPLFATAAWLVWVLSVQSGPTGVALVLAGMLLLTFGLWIRERTATGDGAGPRLGGAAVLAALAGSLWLAWLTDAPSPSSAQASAGTRASGALPHEPYSPERLAAARAEGRPVLVNMTAAWCITCLVNERMALSGPQFAEQLAARDLLYLKGDWTNRDPVITDYLAGFGRSGVPIYVLYPPGGEPRVLPQILTPAIVDAAIASLGDPDPHPTKGENP
ncbi:MAG: protein-disulfide reductase DsbD family protein, partial [Bdellovibrio bacteriovorus]